MPQRIRPALPSLALESARSLRSESTDAERKLWTRLRAGQLNGIRFRRQHPIPPYITDFFCNEAQLVIELDGSQHGDARDQARTRYLEALGLRVIRFWDNDVLMQTDSVVEAILAALIARSAPHPNPTPGGRGAQPQDGE